MKLAAARAAVAGAGLEAAMPSARAAPVNIDAALRCRLRLSRCLVSTGRNSTGYASNTNRPFPPGRAPLGRGFQPPACTDTRLVRSFPRGG